MSKTRTSSTRLIVPVQSIKRTERKRAETTTSTGSNERPVQRTKTLKSTIESKHIQVTSNGPTTRSRSIVQSVESSNKEIVPRKRQRTHQSPKVQQTKHDHDDRTKVRAIFK
jgi:hypothetical protein